MRITIAILLAVLAIYAQDANPLTSEARQAYENIKTNILRSAEKMPEEFYSFKPAPRVRSFGQILGHVAEEQYFFCSTVKGEQKAADIEKAKTTKTEIMAALRESFAYCDSAHNGMTDPAAIQMVKSGEGDRTRLRILWGNTLHDTSHYGNLVTYMRIKGLVPPSTEGQ